LNAPVNHGASSFGSCKAANGYSAPRLSREAVVQLIAASASGTAAPPRPVPPKALSDAEREVVLDVLHSERSVDSSPAHVWTTLSKQGRNPASERTMYRLLARCAEVRERRDQVTHPCYAKPEPPAQRPNEL
jgi:hypothetical protein